MEMTIDEALSYIHGTHKFGIKLGLDNIRYLLEKLDHPQKQLKFVHVAGTNGKGSTCSFIANVLSQAGYKTGLYTSPYIETFNERMRIDGGYISDSELSELVSEVKVTIESIVAEGRNHPSEFEVVTAIAMLYFKRHHCDIVILEVGLGGNLDATNVIDTPLVSVITPLALDHTEYLGTTLAQIAEVKGGIIKKDGITVCHPQPLEAINVIQGICKERNNDLIIVPVEQAQMIEDVVGGLTFKYEGIQYVLKMIAPYQMQNAVVAIEVLKVLKNIYNFKWDEEMLVNGIGETRWLGRLEVLRAEPMTIIDGAHNLHGIKGLSVAIQTLFEGKPITAVVGILGDKDVDGMLAEICPHIHRVIVTSPNNPRALPAERLAEKMRAYEHLEILYVDDQIENAVRYAEAHKESLGIMIYFGSLYMIGEVRTKILKGNH
ncbi:bifunctional folylpolyglutamate synthase/dihydrofolate synthase [Fusibacter ferrireducens]|uniref:tetrahydrofolate synthase n=1 Tax=Fusibacter ferrireducens TaxID=2785058 RepID=A0ABR9ZQS5_9FIRM|nr:folylpolyglutamate synthase/dihydrofolate synthase family protein [Fusibacter ferrireducens]MBF4692803.1 bifunctional folylpolyglutamate synthase/dihydrofolate synthase [Fusibacter ferrireducens]